MGSAASTPIVKDYVREHRRGSQEMFVPLSHPPGHAQCDFGEALVIIGGVEQKAHCFVLDLPHSDGCFVKAYPAETTEAFLGGVPQSILYDNTKLAVARILGDGRREAHPGLHGTPVPLPVLGPVRPSREGQRQGEGRGDGRLYAAQLPGAGPVLREL